MRRALAQLSSIVCAWGTSVVNYVGPAFCKESRSELPVYQRRKIKGILSLWHREWTWWCSFEVAEEYLSLINICH